MKTALTLALLLAALVAAIGYSLWAWGVGSGEPGPDISGHGILAMVLGTLGTLALGGGLMFLVFYSHRRGYDEAADQWRRRHGPDPE